jgi:hypothetical protein
MGNTRWMEDVAAFVAQPGMKDSHSELLLEHRIITGAIVLAEALLDYWENDEALPMDFLDDRDAACRLRRYTGIPKRKIIPWSERRFVERKARHTDE